MLFRNFLGTIEQYCHEHWNKERFIADFLRPLRRAYKNSQKKGWMGGAKGGLTDLTADGTVVAAIEHVRTQLLCMSQEISVNWQ